MASVKNRVKLFALACVSVPVVMSIAMIGGLYGSFCALRNGLMGKTNEEK